jgi:hypothetical protein
MPALIPGTDIPDEFVCPPGLSEDEQDHLYYAWLDAFNAEQRFRARCRRLGVEIEPYEPGCLALAGIAEKMGES